MHYCSGRKFRSNSNCSAQMDHTWFWFIRILFQTSVFVGVSYFRGEKYLVFDSLVFCVSILWFGGCTLHLETHILGSIGAHHDFKIIVIFYSLIIVNIFLFLSLVDIRLKNNRFLKLISVYRELCIVLSPIGGGGPRHLKVFGVVMFHLLSGVLFLCREETAPNVVREMSDRFCATTMTWPTTILCFQFSCWVQIFTFNFEIVMQKIRSAMISAEQTSVEGLPDYTWTKLNHELKIVMHLKRAITDTYGGSIILNQLYTFVCMLLNCTLLSFVELGKDRLSQADWYKYYFVARIMYYFALSYIPHWIGQIALSDVSMRLDWSLLGGDCKDTLS